MMKKYTYNLKNHNRPGIVLLVTMVLLVILSILGYTSTSRIAAKRHRDRFLIDYQNARYACDSGVKYALATLETVSPQLISRPNEPDFSDLFRLTEPEYRQLLIEYADQNALGTTKSKKFSDVSMETDDFNNFENGYTNKKRNTFKDNNEYDFNLDKSYSQREDTNLIDINSMTVRGPYGPSWPQVTQPTELTVGTSEVQIEINDENAKYPIAWVLMNDPNVRREIAAGFRTFCEWMDINDVELYNLNAQFGEISRIKPYKIDIRPVAVQAPSPSRRGRRARGAQQAGAAQQAQTAAANIADFAKLFHSSFLDTELLARETIASESRKESALKYLGLWGSDKVNINTAPRQVLEAAFAFGGNSSAIADAVIRERQIAPFKDIGELKKKLTRYSDSIGKCEKYITTTSQFFTIKVTATCGVARVSAVIAIIKNGNKVDRIAVISG
jgi:hypothetical protein